MLKLKRLGHLLLKTSKIDDTVSFYRDILGFELVEFQSDGHEKMAFLSLGGSGHDIDFMEVSSDELSVSGKSPVHHIAFQVESYESLRDAYFTLVDGGHKIIDATDHESQKSIYIKDPNEYIVEIYHEHKNAIDMFRAGRADNDTPLVFERENA